MYLTRYACFRWCVVHSMVCASGTSCEQRCFVGYAGASGVVLRCFVSTGYVRAGCLVRNAPRWTGHSAGVLGWLEVRVQPPLLFRSSMGCRCVWGRANS